jgi:hypothetical protein
LICSVLLTKYHSSDEIKKDQMGGACGRLGGEDKFMESIGEEIWRK